MQILWREKKEEIPKLNDDNYFIEELKANCERGNWKRYISKLYKTKIYQITDDIILNHSKYWSKCDICDKNICEFNFQKLSSLYFYGYPRLYSLSNYWNNAWLLGVDNGTILSKWSYDKGLTWTESYHILQNYFALMLIFLKLPNHHIICSYRAIGDISDENPNIIYCRKIYTLLKKVS